MTEIKFLHGASHRLQASAAWLAAAYQQGLSVVVYVPDPVKGQALDALLWTHAATGFIPHCQADNALAAETPIVIAQALSEPAHDACLLNLSNEVPPNFSRFQQLIEIVSNDDQERLPGRERYRYYRDRGYPLDNQDISRGLNA